MADKKIKSFHDIKYPYREKFMKMADGMELCYIDKGYGFPIIFLHGMGGDLTNFSHNYKHFKESYRVIGIDLPGFGKSGRLTKDYTIDYYTDILQEFIYNLKIQKCILVGNSMGGHVSTAYTLRHQDKVEKLVLVDSAGLTKLTPMLESMVKYSLNTSLLKMQPKLILHQGVKNNFHDKDLKECQDMVNNVDSISTENSTEYEQFCHAIKSSMQTMLKERIGHMLYKIEIPVLLIWGKYDCMVPINYAYEFKKKTKNSKLIIIDDAGHMPMLEKHKTFNEIVEDFIKTEKKSLLSEIKELLFK